MDKIRATMFGTPAIYWNDRKVSFPFAKMEALLYYLLVVGETTREKLATMFWDEMDDVAAKKNLRNTIYMIKKALSNDLFVTPDRSVIALNTAIAAETDVQAIDTRPLHEFMVDYHGGFLDGFSCRNTEAFEAWAVMMRENLKERLTARLTDTIRQSLAAGSYVAARQYAKDLIQIDEYNEDAYRMLMQVYEGEEAPYKVIEVYEAVKKKFAEELSLQLSKRTVDIYERACERRMVAGQQPTRAEELFFGRVREMKELRALVDSFCLNRHRCQLIMLQGEQGVGKTTLVERLLRSVPHDSFQVLRTQCYQAESEYAYKAWSSIFIQVFKLLQEGSIVLPSLWRRVIAYIFPALETSEVYDGQESVMVAYEFNPTMVEEVMCGVLGKLARQQRLVLVFDDIHWMDAESLAVLHQVLRQHGTRILCLAMCHSEYMNRIERSLWDFERDAMIKKLFVENFNFKEVEALLALRQPNTGKAKDLPHKLFAYTGGNALFLIECLRLLEAGRELGTGSLRLQSVLRERISMLTDNARKILEIASVFFKYANYNDLCKISKFDEFQLVEAIEELEQKKLITREDDPVRSGMNYVFYNLQIRTFVYHQMSTVRQKLLHKMVGNELEDQVRRGQQNKDIYEAILYHYTKAGEEVKVLEYTVRLAEKYFCPQYELFPELNDSYPAGYSNFQDSRRQTMDYLERIAALLAQLSAASGDSSQLVPYQVAYWEMAGRHYIWRGEHAAGLKMIHRLLRLATTAELRDYAVKGCQQMVFLGIQTGRPSIIKRFAERLAALAEQGDMAEKKAAALRFMGMAAALVGSSRQAEKYYRQSIGLFRKLDIQNNCYILNIAAGYNYIGNLRRDAGHLPEALKYYERAVKIAGHKKLSEGVAAFYINAGYTAFRMGDSDRAHKYMAEALAVGDSFGDSRGYWCARSYCTLYCVLAIIAVRENCCHDGRRYLVKADEFMDRYHDQSQRGQVLCTKLEIRLLMDREPAAAAVFGDYLTRSAAEYYRQAQSAMLRTGSGDPAALATLMEKYAGKV